MRKTSIRNIALLSASLLILPACSFAAETKLIDTPAKVIGVFTRITNWLFTGLMIMSVIMLIVAGYKYLFSGGSEENTGAARKTIVYAVIGIAVAMVSKAVPFLIQSVLGVKV
jgi:magnesium-transporting ATPase (P-type)